MMATETDLNNGALNIQKALNCSNVFATLLAQRGFSPDSLQSFLYPKMEHLTSPSGLKDMDKAVERIIAAVKKREKIAVYGDYDVDGVTGAFVLGESFRWLKIPIDVHIPHRTRDGYGIQIPTLEKMKADGISVVISVDCGVRAFEPIKWAKENGIDVIITDHHQPDGENLPEAFAVINPHRTDCTAKMESLTGVGVAFKLAQALLAKSKISYNLAELLPFVALGMIADMTTLTGEARTLVKLGFNEIFNSSNPGLQALCEICLEGESLTSSDVGFQLAPRINAAGRLGEAQLVLDLLNSANIIDARAIAMEIDGLNDARKQIQAEVSALAVRLAETQIKANGGEIPPFLVLSGMNWHRGVVGIVASRITNLFDVPALVFSEEEDGTLYGSGRSVNNFPLLEALTSGAEFFTTFGGHQMACGATLRVENLEKLRQALITFAENYQPAEISEPAPRFELEIKAAEISMQLAKELKLMEPFGNGNPEPVFSSVFQLEDEPRILKEKHLKFALFADESSEQTLNALWWNSADLCANTDWQEVSEFPAIYKVQTNSWKGKTSVQLILVDADL